jgi:hypothetical protein
MTLTARPPRGKVSQTTVDALAEYAVAQPGNSITSIAKHFGLSNSLMSTWLYRSPSRRLAQWLAQGDNLNRWQAARPNDSIGSGMADLVLEYQIAQEATGAAVINAAPPTGDSAASLRDTVADIQAQAQSIDRECQEVLDALDLITAWQAAQDGLTAKAYEADKLADQLRLARREIDGLKREAQARNLAVHSRD